MHPPADLRDRSCLPASSPKVADTPFEPGGGRDLPVPIPKETERRVLLINSSIPELMNYIIILSENHPENATSSQGVGQPLPHREPRVSKAEIGPDRGEGDEPLWRRGETPPHRDPELRSYLG